MSDSFIKFLLSQLIANLADIFFRVTVIANIYVISKSVIATSLVPISIGLSSFFASFLVPIVTRRLSLNKVLFLSQLVKTILLALLVVLFTQIQVITTVLLYLFVIVISMLDGFASPVSYAIVPRYARDLGKANSILSMSSEGIQLLGWGLGGFLFALFGLSSTMIIVLILYMLSTYLMLFLPNVEVEVLDSESSMDSLIKGWKLSVRDARIRLFIQANLFEILSSTIWVSSIILVFVKEVLGKTESYWGYSNTAYSIGVILGGLIVFKQSEKFLANKLKSIVSSLFAMALVTFCILLFPNAKLFLVFSALIGFLSQLKEVPENVFLQESVNENDLINVCSVIEVISTLAFSVFVLLMSYFTAYFGIGASFLVSVVCFILESIIIYKKRSYLIG